MLPKKSRTELESVILALEAQKPRHPKEARWQQQTLSALRTALADVDDQRQEYFRKKAQKERHSDGDLEIDDHAVVSLSGEGGAYVQAWVWVYEN